MTARRSRLLVVVVFLLAALVVPLWVWLDHAPTPPRHDQKVALASGEQNLELPIAAVGLPLAALTLGGGLVLFQLRGRKRAQRPSVGQLRHAELWTHSKASSARTDPGTSVFEGDAARSIEHCDSLLAPRRTEP